MLELADDLKGLILTICTLYFGTIATFLSGYTRISEIQKFVWISILSIITNVLTWLLFGFGWYTFCIAVGTILFVIACAVIILKKESVSRSKINKLIIKFTENADKNSPIKIFGGDLNFFGKVSDNSILTNKQFNQIKSMCFSEVKILCLKPTTSNKNDYEMKLRIGFLLEELSVNLHIKFFNKEQCHECSVANCIIWEVCENCKDKASCGEAKYNCAKLKQVYNNHCYNPDLDIRGRIVKKSNTSAEVGAITIKDRPGKSYILKVYNSDTKECSMYVQIWDIWWRKCKEDKELLEECLKLYNEFKKENPLIQVDTLITKINKKLRGKP